MRDNEAKDEGFFSRIGNRAHRLRMVASAMVDAVLVRQLDEWQAVVLLVVLLFFFGFALPMGITFLGIWYGAAYAYFYAFLWIGVAGLLAYREVNRRDKAMIGTEWVSNPNAIDEYIVLVKKKD